MAEYSIDLPVLFLFDKGGGQVLGEVRPRGWGWGAGPYTVAFATGGLSTSSCSNLTFCSPDNACSLL